MGGSIRSGIATDAGRDPDEGSVPFLLSGAAPAARDRGESQGALRSGDHKADGSTWGVGLHHEGLRRRRGVLGGLRAPRQGDRECRQRVSIGDVGAVFSLDWRDLHVWQRRPEGAISA